MACLVTTINADIDEPIRVCAIRVSFLEDQLSSTTGNGKFLMENEGLDCSQYTIDIPPHDREYFESQLLAVNSYFDKVSYGKFGLNLEQSAIYPNGLNDDYQLDNYMNYYNPYNNHDLQEKRLTELFRDALSQAYFIDQINYSDFDIVVIFHAGIGQDFSLPFLDPTPEDIPSTYIDQSMLENHLGDPYVSVGGHLIEHGIILPESQNHLLFDIAESIFSDAFSPCNYQFGLTGTFSLMLGFAVGLPPLWNIDTGESGVGIFGLMDQGSNNGSGVVPAPPTAWSRIHAGWENPVIYEFGSQIKLPSRSENHIVKVPIRNDEYFLIENRNNNIRPGVSIDSIRYLMGQNSTTGNYPSFYEVLYDSSLIQKDTNGVIIDVPNYDIALPASGLLIWHIDETRINSSINNYEINNNVTNRGIDLEEADGAQDIGYVSIHMFNDPSTGYFGDMWFNENSQYYLANPAMEGMKPEFGPYTFPSTDANDGSISFITINEISTADDTMTFYLDNIYLVHGILDTSIDFYSVFDINADGNNDLIGGKDSLFLFLSTDTLIEQIYFHDIQMEDLSITFTRQSDHTIIDIVEYIQDSTFHSRYEYFIPSKEMTLLYNTWFDSLVYPISNYNNTSIEWKSKYQWDNHTKRVFASPHNFAIDIGTNGITIDRFGNPETKWQSNEFHSLTGIDLDLDAKTDLLALNETGILYGFNSELILMPGFPLDIPLSGPILSQDILNDEYPEIIAKSLDGRVLYVLDRKGNILLQLASEINNDLVAIDNYQEKASIFTQSLIFQFDSYSESNGNSWNFEHGNAGHSRTVELGYTFSNESENLLIRAYTYPNPIWGGNGTIRVETIGASNISVDIYDLSGYFIKNFSSDIIENGNQIVEWIWNVDEIESGVYIANVSSSNAANIETKIIKVAVIH